MNSFAFTINFKDQAAVDKYEQLHKEVWPELKDALDEIGVKSMQLFFMPPLKLYMYIEAEESFVPNRDFKEYVNIGAKVKEWDEMCGGLLCRHEANDGITEWFRIDKLYAYDRRDHRVSF